jgi:hypothetical protein
MDKVGFSRVKRSRHVRRLVAASLMLLVSLALSATAARGTQPPAYYALPGGSSGCQRGPLQFCYVTRPSHFVFYGGYYTSVTWKHWGGPAAIGSGHAVVDLCSPECGDGDVVTGTVHIEMRGLRRDGGREVYACMVARGPKGSPVFSWGDNCKG